MTKKAIAVLALLCFGPEPEAKAQKIESAKRGELLRTLKNSESDRLLPGGSFDSLIRLGEKDFSKNKKVALSAGQPPPLADPAALLKSYPVEKTNSILPGGGFDGMIFLKKTLSAPKFAKSFGLKNAGSEISNLATLITTVKEEKSNKLLPGGGFDAFAASSGDVPSSLSKVSLPAAKPPPRAGPAALTRLPDIEQSLLILPGGEFPYPIKQKTFYIHVSGKNYGPYTISQLREYLKNGKLNENHPVSQDGKNWIRLKEVEELSQSGP